MSKFACVNIFAQQQMSYFLFQKRKRCVRTHCFKSNLRFASVFVAENNPKLFKKQVETQVFAVRSRNKFANFFKIDFLL